MESSSQLKKELAEQAAAAKTLELDLHAQRDVRSRKFLNFLVKFSFFMLKISGWCLEASIHSLIMIRMSYLELMEI